MKKRAKAAVEMLKDATFISSLTFDVTRFLEIFSLKVLEINDVYAYKSSIRLSIQVDYSYPPVTVIYRLKDSTLELSMNRIHISDL